MKKIIIFTVLLISCLAQIFASSHLANREEKFVLPCYNVKDSVIRTMAVNLSDYIMRKKNGFQWPVTKIVFLQEGDKTKLNVVAIDNGWARLFETGEKPYGYFIANSRMFIVSTKENATIDLTQYFELSEEEGERTFYKSDTPPSQIVRNPRWVYHYKGHSTALELLESANLQGLGR